MGLSREAYTVLAQILAADSSRQMKITAHFPVAGAEHGRVDGKENRFGAAFFCALDQVGGDGAVRRRVQLKPDRL